MKDERRHDRCSKQAGVTLIELMIAVLILAIVSAGLLGVFSIATSQNKQQGEWATRTTEYCQDKMEQLMALQFSDTSSDTTTMPWSAVAYSAGYSAWSGSTSYGSGSNVNYNSTSYVSNIASNSGLAPGTTTSPTGGTGLSAGGAITPSSPVTGYVDYLDVNGNLLGGGATAPSGAFYIRVWQISTSGNLDTITVVATTLSTAGMGFVAPTSTLVCYKANF